MITFRNITRENFDAVISLEVHEGQLAFMESPMYSLAECTFEESFVAKAICNDEIVVGFILYYFVADNPDYVFVHRLMIDKAQQGKGLGKAALRAGMDIFKEEFPSIGCVELMHYPDNEIGAAVYESLGFQPTGENRESEPCRCELGTTNPNRCIEIVRRKYYTL